MKTNPFFLALLSAAILTPSGWLRADISSAAVSSEATIRGGTSADSDVDEAGPGYVMVKHDNSPFGVARKSYFEFDLAGLSPDTSSTAKLTIHRAANSGQTRVQLWGLNQGYPAFNPEITWNTAQANETDSNSMLTSGPFTATPLGFEVVVPTTFETYDITLPGGWGDVLHDDKVVLVLTAVEDAGNNSNGLRIRSSIAFPEFATVLTFNTTTGNLAPGITPIAGQTVGAGELSEEIAFTVEDDTTPAGDILTYATSSDENLIPSSSFVFTGQGVGGARTIQFTPAAVRTGTAIITVYAQDTGGMENSTAFIVTVFQTWQEPELPVRVSTEATIRGGADADNDVDEAAAGYIMVKYDNAPFNTARKGYFEFDLAGKSPDTGSPAALTIYRAANSGQTRVQIWGLDQGYPGFNANITWNTAQANDIDGNRMLTSGPLTATPLGTEVVVPGAFDTFTILIPGGWGDLLVDDKLVLVVTAVEDAASSGNGLRIRSSITSPESAATLMITTTGENVAPSITSIADQTLDAGVPSEELAFTVSDDATPDGEIQVSATSSNDGLIPASSFTFTGQGISGNRTIQFTPAAFQSGTAIITIYAEDTGGLQDSTEFTVTVLQNWVEPDTAVQVSTEATIRGGSSADADVDEVAAGYIMVKHDNAPFNVARKAYFEFDLAGASPDTGSPAALILSRAANNGQTRVQLWGLNQAYPGFNSVITWNTAQANETDSNSMLTSGGFTATPLGSEVIVPQTFVTHTITIPPGWGDVLQDNKVVLVLTGVQDSANSASGLRLLSSVLNPESAATLMIQTGDGVIRPNITGIRIVGGNAEIDFAAGQGDPATAFSVIGAAAVSGAFAPVAAEISELGPGSFRATIPVSGDEGFFRVQGPGSGF